MKLKSPNNSTGKSMKIVVIGGSGLIGAKVVANLRRRGHDVVAASPSSGTDSTGRTRPVISARKRGPTEGHHGSKSTLYYGIALNDQSLTPGPNPLLGTTRFEDWLNNTK